MQPLAKVCKDQLGAYLDDHQYSAVSARRRDTRVVFAQALAPIVAAAEERRLVRVTRDGHTNLLTRMQQALAGQGYALIVYSMEQMRDFIVFPAFENAMNRIKEQLGDVKTVLEPGFYGRFHMFCVVRSDIDLTQCIAPPSNAAKPTRASRQHRPQKTLALVDPNLVLRAQIHPDQLANHLSEQGLTAVPGRDANSLVVFPLALADLVNAANAHALARVRRDQTPDLLTAMQQALAQHGFALFTCNTRGMREFFSLKGFTLTMNRIKGQLSDVVTVLEPGFYGRFYLFCVVRPNFRADLLALAQTTCADANQSEAP